MTRPDYTKVDISREKNDRLRRIKNIRQLKGETAISIAVFVDQAVEAWLLEQPEDNEGVE